MKINGRVLIIAGSDSGGGAGIQADIKTVTALGGYAATAITALTAQNTKGVHGVFDVDPAFIKQQIDVVLDDIGADCIKIGMLNNVAVIEAVYDALKERNIPLVLDPVMIAKGGASLLNQDAVTALKEKLIPLAAIVTPNLPEAAVLIGQKIETVEEMFSVTAEFQAMASEATLLKGGHLKGDTLTDLLITKEEILGFESKRIDTKNTHGTGCTLASAIAIKLAQGETLQYAVAAARDYVMAAIHFAPCLGKGHGPLNHCASL
ncbi:MAG: bifunctional hydroxymethylpyrimidine kinase/phosphomethylpyrimidine kinase [Alphaproteobacteria bacterium]